MSNVTPSKSPSSEKSNPDWILITHQEGITTLELNRPAQYNALSEEMLQAFQSALDALDEQTRVVIIKAKGKAFCAGHDLKQMRANPDQAYYQALFERCSTLMNTLIKVKQPVIAQVQGIATAAGCQLVANCDLAIASEESRFAVSGINVGLFCSTPAVPLSRNIARKQAFEMLVTGEFISAQQALDWGLLNRVVPAHELDEAVQTMASMISHKSATAISAGKALFYAQLEKPLEQAYEQAANVMACNMMTDDAAEGIDAFKEKRQPNWTHR